MGFDDLDDGGARALLLRCLSAPDWAEQVLASRPYATKQDLTDAADRPYGLIEAQIRRDDAPDEAVAWRDVPGFC